MDAKCSLYLLLIILGTIAVQGARPGEEEKNVNAKRQRPRECYSTLIMKGMLLADFFLPSIEVYQTVWWVTTLLWLIR